MREPLAWEVVYVIFHTSPCTLTYNCLACGFPPLLTGQPLATWDSLSPAPSTEASPFLPDLASLLGNKQGDYPPSN